MLDPFPEQEFKPYGLHDILATLDVCANIHATKDCDNKGYDIMSPDTAKVIQENEELGMDSNRCN